MRAVVICSQVHRRSGEHADRQQCRAWVFITPHKFPQSFMGMTLPPPS